MSVPSGVSSPVTTVDYPNVESVFGPMLIGTLLSTALYGITCVQTYDYFIISNEDPRWQKFIIVLLLFLDTFDTVLNTHVIYYYLVKNFTNASALSSPIWSASCRTLVHGLSSFVIRAMFARRVYIVGGGNIILGSWIMATSLSDFVVGILIMVKSLAGRSSDVLPSLSHLLYISFSFGTASDVSIACALYWLLRSMKTGFYRTDSLVKALLLYIVTNCFLVVADSTLGFILYIAKPETLIYLVFYMSLGKLYINAFLASLNAREKLSKNRTDVVLSLSRISDRTRQNVNTSVTTYDKPNLRHSNNAMSINVQTSVERRIDEGP